jgi:hypothetical protein
VSVYVLVAIVKKRLKIQASLYEMLQIPSLTMFEQPPFKHARLIMKRREFPGRQGNSWLVV